MAGAASSRFAEVLRWLGAYAAAAIVAGCALKGQMAVYMPVRNSLRGIDGALGALGSLSYWLDVAVDAGLITAFVAVLALPFALLVSALREYRGRRPNRYLYGAAGIATAIFWLAVVAILVHRDATGRFEPTVALAELIRPDFPFFLIAGLLGGWCHAAIRRRALGAAS